MRRYSIFSLAREALRGHSGWGRAWADPEPRAGYEVVIVGAGGHGLATAYYLAKNHGVRNVAVLEKGWLGGGNTGRNTTIIRSNYLQPASMAIYEKARGLYETLSQELNYNVMFSPRGVLMLAQKGFPLEEFMRLRLGVVVMKDELEYRREVKWMDEIGITFAIAGLAPDGSRFKVVNEILNAAGALCARVTCTGGFMDLDARKLVAPPPNVLAAYQSLPRTDDYAELPSSIKARG